VLAHQGTGISAGSTDAAILQLCRCCTSSYSRKVAVSISRGIPAALSATVAATPGRYKERPCCTGNSSLSEGTLVMGEPAC
jgi:hypothetical protein